MVRWYAPAGDRAGSRSRRAGGRGPRRAPACACVRRHRPARRDLRHRSGEDRADRARRDAVPRGRRRRAAAEDPRDGPPGAERRARDDDPHELPARRHRHAGRRVPRAVDDDLREDRRRDRAARSRRRPGRPPEHRLPGHDRVRHPAPRRARPNRRRRLLPRADRRGQCPQGAAHAAPDHRRRHRPSRRACGRGLRAARHEDDPHDDQGSRAREAVHEHVAVHEVRRREPVPDDLGPGGRGLHEGAARRSATTTRAPATCLGPGSRPARACSRTRCSSPRSRATTSRWARRRCRSTRACRRTSCRPCSAATARSRARRSASSGWRSRPSRTTPARRSRTSSGSSCPGPAPGSCARTRTSIDDRLVPLDEVLRESDVVVLGAPHAAYRELQVGGKDVVDVWGAMGGGIRL